MSCTLQRAFLLLNRREVVQTVQNRPNPIKIEVPKAQAGRPKSTNVVQRDRADDSKTFQVVHVSAEDPEHRESRIFIY
jgi:hypothetical protein